MARKLKTQAKRRVKAIKDKFKKRSLTKILNKARKYGQLKVQPEKGGQSTRTEKVRGNK